MSTHDTVLAGTSGSASAEVIAIGNSQGIVLTREVLAKLNVARGDMLYLIESPEGFLLTPLSPAVIEQVEAGKRFMRRYGETFQALAK